MLHAHAKSGAYEWSTEASHYIAHVLQNKPLNVMA